MCRSGHTGDFCPALALGNVACPCVTALRLLTPAEAGLQTPGAAPLVREPSHPHWDRSEEEPALGCLRHVGMDQHRQPQCWGTGLSDPGTIIFPHGGSGVAPMPCRLSQRVKPHRDRGRNLPPLRVCSPRCPAATQSPTVGNCQGQRRFPEDRVAPAGTRLWLPSHV